MIGSEPIRLCAMIPWNSKRGDATTNARMVILVWGNAHKDLRYSYKIYSLGSGSICTGTCPDGYTDKGTKCSISSDTYYPCPWYDVCGVAVAKGCFVCKDGYKKSACSCHRSSSTIDKPTYDRGHGVRANCTDDLEESVGKCYPKCKDSYVGQGDVCWTSDSGKPDYAVACNPVSYGKTQEDCDTLTKVLTAQGFTAAECLAPLAESIRDGKIDGPKACSDMIQKVLPSLSKTQLCSKTT